VLARAERIDLARLDEASSCSTPPARRSDPPSDRARQVIEDRGAELLAVTIDPVRPPAGGWKRSGLHVSGASDPTKLVICLAGTGRTASRSSRPLADGVRLR
jgi:hypothetical protein